MKKTVLITGASGDIGTALSKYFVQNNYIVIGTYYKNESSIINLKKDLGNDFYYFQCDLSKFNNSKFLINKIKSDGFNLDLLINNAGMSLIGLLQDIDANSWEQIWNCNVTSMVSLCKEVIPMFLKQGHGKIINISSIWGNVGASMEVPYSTTKGAINSFTKALALELAPSNIQVNAISPGIIDTKMNSHLSSEEINTIIEEIPSGRLGTPEDVAKLTFDVANTSPYLTGEIITLNGGWM